ncbi:unnamed protein product [Sphagnum compactum]
MQNKALLVFVGSFVASALLICSVKLFTSLRTVHKYSESAKKIMVERYGDDHPAASWPVQGSVEYYQLLRNHDGARLAAAASGSRRHLLSTASTPPTSYTFAEGNETEQYADFFYAFIDIGTPSVEYFVALDTATDLLWVPCECQQCAPLSAPGTGDNRTNILNAYSPSSSSTSKPVNCSNPLCIDTTTCATSVSQQCPYTQSRPDLLYTGTNSSGLLFEDNLYFIPEQGGARISSPVVFGCGQTQTGDFLNGDFAPDGVLGLGTGDISVPSTLSRELGLLDSFSICTNLSGTGRIAFGDKGPITQQTTPFVSNSSFKSFVAFLLFVVSTINQLCGFSSWWWLCLLSVNFRSFVAAGFGNTYSPNSSLTSQPVNCSNPLCSINQTTCDGSQQQSCPYTQSTFYSDTNSSGFLVEDNLYFIPEYGGEPVSVPVVFGCGHTQTGDFLNGTIAPDGVLGLGTGEISVPSTLRRELGLLDSFSICNNINIGTGRIAFGDKGPITQHTTPFVSNSSQENLVQITELEVGNKSIPVGLNASFDTLVLYTYLPSAIYTQFANSCRSVIKLPDLNLTTLGLGYLDLDLCFATTNPRSEIPTVKFIFPNGETFEQGGFVEIRNETQIYGFCLGIQNSTLPEIIIGLLSMSGYSFTFNQEDKLLGWIPSTCFDDITASAPAPAPIFAPVSTPTFSTPPSPPPPSSAPTSPSPPSLSPKLSPSTGPSTAPPPSPPPPSAGVMEFVLPSRIISLSLLGFLLYLSLL